jgi:hypothetical protein
MKVILLITVWLSFIIHGSSLAGQDVNLDAHVHGVSEMTIVFEKQTLEIEVKSPAINLVGFEHRAKTQKNIAAVKNAELLLSNASELFLFSGDNCTLVEQHIDVSSMIDHDTKSGVNEHQHDKSHSNEGRHNEVIANYYYRCEKKSTISSITIKLFELFPYVQQIKAMWVTEAQQGALTLSAKNKVINLR